MCLIGLSYVPAPLSLLALAISIPGSVAVEMCVGICWNGSELVNETIAFLRR